MIPRLVRRSFGRRSLRVSNIATEDAYKKEYTIDDHGTEKNIVVEIIDTAGQEEFSAGLHDKVTRMRSPSLVTKGHSNLPIIFFYF